MTEIWLDGEFLDADAARLSVADRGFLLGDAAFETLTAVPPGPPRRWARHRDRLTGALDWLEIAPPDWSAVLDAAIRLSTASDAPRLALRLTVSRGAYGGGLAAPSGRPGTVLLTARPAPPPPAAIRLATTPDARRAGLVSERFKLACYAEPLAARRAALAAGADMGLMVSARDSAPVCADCASLFWIEEDAVFTPPVSEGALPGTTRAALIAAAARDGLVIAERRARPGLAGAQAAVLTNAVMGVVAVSALDARPLDLAHPLVARLKALEAVAD